MPSAAIICHASTVTAWCVCQVESQVFIAPSRTDRGEKRRAPADLDSLAFAPHVGKADHDIGHRKSEQERVEANDILEIAHVTPPADTAASLALRRAKAIAAAAQLPFTRQSP